MGATAATFRKGDTSTHVSGRLWAEKWSWGEPNPVVVGVAKLLVTAFSSLRIWPVGVTAGVTALDVYRRVCEM